jgi:hypothetical protein
MAKLLQAGYFHDTAMDKAVGFAATCAMSLLSFYSGT